MTRFDYKQLPYGNAGKHADQNRFNWRSELLLVHNESLIKDKVVLDLACNTGRLAYPCLAMGAKKVVGVEARMELIDEGSRFLSGSGFESRMEWVNADVFEFLDSAEMGQYETILCFGFLYHTTKQVDFFRSMKRLRPSNVILDTSVAKNYLWYGLKDFLVRSPALFMIAENSSLTSDTTDEDGVAFWPSCSFIEKMCDISGFEVKRIDYKSHVKDWSGMQDYKRGIRASWVAENRTR